MFFLLRFQVDITNMFAELSGVIGTHLVINYVYLLEKKRLSLTTFKFSFNFGMSMLPIYSHTIEQSISILAALYVCFYVFRDNLSSSLTTSVELLEVSRGNG